MPIITGPDGVPLIVSDAAAQALQGPTPTPTRPPQPRISHNQVEKDEGDDVPLPDGRVLRLIKRVMFEALDMDEPVPVEWWYRGDDGLMVIVQVRKPDLKFKTVSLRYQKQRPNWKDMRMVRSALFSLDAIVVQRVPSVADFPNESPSEKYTIHLSEFAMEVEHAAESSE